MFSPMRRAVPETAAMQGPRVRFGDLRHPQLFDSQKSEPQGGAALTIENRPKTITGCRPPGAGE
jgi:hypothetical protein